MHVISVDIGNHAKFRVECQAKGRCQERQLNDKVDSDVRVQPKPSADLRQPAICEQKAGDHLEQERRQTDPFKPLLEVEDDGRVAIAQRPREDCGRKHQVTTDPNSGANEMKSNQSPIQSRRGVKVKHVLHR